MEKRAETLFDMIRDAIGGGEQSQIPKPPYIPYDDGTTFSSSQFENNPSVPSLQQIPESARQTVDLGQQPIVNNDAIGTMTDASMNEMGMSTPTPWDMASIPNNTTGEGNGTPEQGFMSKIGDGISDFWNDEAKMANLAIGLNSMRLNPDPNLAKAMQTKIDRLQKNKGRNATVSQLRNAGRNDLADAVESGAMTATDAWNIAFKAPSAFQDKVKWAQKNPDLAKEYNIFGGTNIDMGEGKYLDYTMKGAAEKQKIWNDRGEMARSTLNTLSELDRAIQSFGETGPGAEFKQDIRVMADKLGLGYLIDESKMNDAQYIQATKNRLVAEELRKNKGPQTDFDSKFAGTYIPGLGISTDANKKLISYGQSIALQQRIFSDMSNEVSLGSADDVRAMHQKINFLASSAAGAIPRKDGSYMTFKEYFDSNAVVNVDGKDVPLSSLSAVERLTRWAETADKLLGYKR